MILYAPRKNIFVSETENAVFDKIKTLLLGFL